jgi:lipase maturation factor 1
MNIRAVANRVELPFVWVIGESHDPPKYRIARWMFLRALGVVYLIAFVSLWVQVQGLMGPRGILPAQDFLDLVRVQLGAERYWLVPTILWLGAGARGLNIVCGLGALGSVLLMSDVWPRGCLIALWALYLSLVAVGQDFLSFQWDALLLEAGFLAMLLAPGHLLPRRHPVSPPRPLALVLLWGLLFRLVFESGAVKLTSGDPTWRHLTALDFHFFTQPLPTWTAWYANLLPSPGKRLEVLGTFLLELVPPVLIFCGRRLRLIGWVGIVVMQLLIMSTGNYAFFNLLTLALSLLLLDDGIWRRVLPVRALRFVSTVGHDQPRPNAAIVTVGLGPPLLLLQLVSFATTVAPGAGAQLPRFLEPVFGLLAPFRSLNGYGLFRVMTTERLEIIVEGSNDGTDWRTYEFRYKPGPLEQRPRFVEPHQPRLDWQMWFAALDQFNRTTWFQAFLLRLLEGSPEVLALLASNPFPDHPPKYLRATLYDYRFTDLTTRRASHAWWSRSRRGAYSPMVGLAGTAAPGQ